MIETSAMSSALLVEVVDSMAAPQSSGDRRNCALRQAEHTDAGFTLRVYAHGMRRDEGDKERLRALVEGRHGAPSGTDARSEPTSRRRIKAPETTKPPR
jgi:hypothetical protein